jgi:hypothetical protein
MPTCCRRAIHANWASVGRLPGAFASHQKPAQGCGPSSARHAYEVEHGVYALLDLPGYAVLSDARDVNPLGEISASTSIHPIKINGFLLNREGFTPIDFPGADVVFPRAFGIDPEGNIVGFYQTKDALGALHAHGFVATRSKDN